MDRNRYGPWALIVGGSEGVGAAFARKVAGHGFKLVLAARRPGPLAQLASELRADGAEVRTLSVDLSEHDALDQVRTITDGIDVGLMIYNAGANSKRGNFVELEPDVFRTVIAVNVIGQSEFARHFGRLMKQRGRGGIILVGSMAGYVGAPGLAAYCGAKAFSRTFSEALWCECEPFGVDVLHLNLGFTATPAMARLGYDLATAQSPDDVAQEGLDQIANGPVWIAGGEGNRDQALRQSQADNRAATVRSFSLPSIK